MVSEASLLETRRPHTPLPEGGHFGLGWIVGEYRGLEHLDYTGGNLGYTSYVGLLPAADLGVAVLTNAALAAPFKQAVAEYVYEAALGLSTRPTPVTSRPSTNSAARWPSSAAWSGPAPSPGRSPGCWAATAPSPGWRCASTPPAASSWPRRSATSPSTPSPGRRAPSWSGSGPG